MAETDAARVAASLRATLGANGSTPHANKALAFLDREAPPIDLSWLPSVLAAYADDMAQVWDQPPEPHILSGLAVLLTAVGQNVQLVMPGGDTAPASDWFALVGNSGSGKSPIMDNFVRPLWERQHEFDKVYKARQREYEAIKAAGGPEARHAGTRPTPITLVHDNSTFEAMTIDLSAVSDTGSLWYSDELLGLFSSLSDYKTQGGGRSFTQLLTMWRARDIRRRRVREGELTIAERPVVSILGSLQPKKVHMMGPNDDGRLARFLVVPTVRSKGRTREPAPELAREWDSLVRAILDSRPPALQTLGLEDSASELWVGNAKKLMDWSMELPEFELDYVQPFVSKLEQHIARLVIALWAGIMEKAWPLPAVDRPTVAQAWRIGERLLLHQLAVFADAAYRGSLKTDALMEQDAVERFHAILSSRFKSPAHRRDVQISLHRRLHGSTFGATVAAWERRGFGRVVKDGKEVLMEWDS